MPLMGSQCGKDAVGSVSALLNAIGVGSIECPSAVSTTMVFPQAHDLPHWVAVNKVHHCFEPWILICTVRIPGAVGFKCSQARRVASTMPRTRELTDESLSPFIFSSKKNMNTRNAKAPLRPTKGCAPRIKIQGLLLLVFFAFIYLFFDPNSFREYGLFACLVVQLCPTL